MKIQVAPAKGSDLKIGDIVRVGGIHYVQVISEHNMPNGLLLSAIRGVTSPSVRNIAGSASQNYEKVDKEAFDAMRQTLKKYPSSGIASGQINSVNATPNGQADQGKAKVEAPADNTNGGGLPATPKPASMKMLDALSKGKS